MNKKYFRIMSRFFSLLAFLILILIFCGFANALMLGLSIKDLATGADIIVQGTVFDTESMWNKDQGNIYTKVVIKVEESLKGQEDMETLSIIVPGGTVGDARQIVSDMPVFFNGLQAVLFLKKISQERLEQQGLDGGDDSETFYETFGLFQGVVEIQNGLADGIPIHEFKQEIDYLLDHGETRPGSQLMDLTDAVIVRQASYVYEGDRWEGDWPVVNYKIHNSFSSSQLLAIQNADSTWNSAGAKFLFNYEGLHYRTGGNYRNGVNEVCWADLGPNTLGMAAWYMLSTGGGPFYIVEADFSFNIRYSFSTSTPATSNDMESVALHEFGHWLSLGHSEYPDAVMWYQLTTGTTKRNLHSDDVAGIRSIYGASPDQLVPGSPVLVAPGDGNMVAGRTISFSWNIPSGSPDKYHIQLATNSSFVPAAYNNEYVTGTSISLSGFPEDGTTYFWRVRAYNNAGWGAWSNIRSFIYGKMKIFYESFYLSNNPDVGRVVNKGEWATGWHHFILFGEAEGRNFGIPSNSPGGVSYSDFNETYYLANNPDVGRVVNNGDWASGWQHFIVFGEAEGRSYSRPANSARGTSYSNFNETYYLANNPDVGCVVNKGDWASGWQHFIVFGEAEGRSYSKPANSPGGTSYTDFNEAYYLANNPDVGCVVNRGDWASGWQHFMVFGESEGRSYSRPANSQGGVEYGGYRPN